MSVLINKSCNQDKNWDIIYSITTGWVCAVFLFLYFFLYFCQRGVLRTTNIFGVYLLTGGEVISWWHCISCCSTCIIIFAQHWILIFNHLHLILCWDFLQWLSYIHHLSQPNSNILTNLFWFFSHIIQNLILAQFCF